MAMIPPPMLESMATDMREPSRNRSRYRVGDRARPARLRVRVAGRARGLDAARVVRMSPPSAVGRRGLGYQGEAAGRRQRCGRPRGVHRRWMAGLRRVALPVRLLVLALLQRRGTGDHRLMLAGRYRARLGGGAGNRTATCRQQQICPGQWPAAGAARRGRRRLRPAARADHHRAAPRPGAATGCFAPIWRRSCADTGCRRPSRTRVVG